MSMLFTFETKCRKQV